MKTRIFGTRGIAPIAIVLAVVLAAPLAAVDVQRDILRPAQAYAGAEYCLGGVSPPCFDCSGFVLRVYGNHVPDLPRVSRDMARVGQPVPRESLRPGDLVFFATGGRSDVVTHVAIYMGQDSIIHAISNGPNRGVTITPLSARYWSTRYYSSSRVLPDPVPVARVAPNEAIRFSQGTYTGDLDNGEPHGRGTMDLNNGDHYEGEFRQGFFEGTGTYTWANGDRYRGGFRSGEMHGEGRFVTASGDILEGRWESGELVRTLQESAPAATPRAAARSSYIRERDSPWETWDGVVEGDFRIWQEQQQRAFEEHRRRSEPPRSN